MDWAEGMKRLGLVFLTVLVSLGIAAGCGGGGWLSRETGSADVPAAPAAAVSERRPQETEEIPVFVSARERAVEAEIFRYGYSALATEEERLLYREILRSLQEREEETELSTLNQDLLEPVFAAVMADHPEIFYADGYSCTSYRLGDTVRKLTFTGSYTMDGQEIERRAGLLEEAIDGWLAGLPEGGDYEKARYLYETLIFHTEYQQGAQDNQNICSVFLNGRSVCQGYAKALQLLYQRAQLPAMLVTGEVNGQGHAWIVARLDGEWYHIDPTWGDASWQQDGQDFAAEGAQPSVNYDYFCVTAEQILKTHVPDEGQPLPDCNAVEDNYYRREGCFLEEADPERIGEIFRRAIDAGEDIVRLQCSQDSVYEEAYRFLIEEQGVFSWLPGTAGSVAYADNPQQRTFCFWLDP